MELMRDNAEDFMTGGAQHVISKALGMYKAEGQWTPARKALMTTVRYAGTPAAVRPIATTHLVMTAPGSCVASWKIARLRIPRQP